MSRFSLRQLEAFIAVTEAKNFIRASENMHLSASAVSNLVADLEDRLGFSVFERTTRKVALTTRGREFLGYAKSVLSQLTIAEAAAIDLKEHNVSIVKVAAPQVVAASFLPKIIAAFMLDNPGVRVHIVDSSVTSLSDELLNGTADLAIGPEQEVSHGVSVNPLFESRWVLWCHPDHPLALKNEAKWSELSPYFISAAGDDHQHSLAPVINSLAPNERFNISDIVASVTTVLGLVSENIAIAMTPEFVENLGMHKHLKKLSLQEPELNRRYVLYSQSKLWVSEPVKAFTLFVNAYLEKNNVV